ncbi:putative membrane protein [Brevibacterium mcbrellneri ATCC 49030]|uniref:Putative membrane protein n=1 Tax=Brevibacterium mcbrellneri ATCC 49030 TaxID=585530 RepID=D4YLJ0_9MICO|nr:putative membrane protein [Brevibacterium mcbrellneri ATCC 49030]
MKETLLTVQSPDTGMVPVVTSHEPSQSTPAAVHPEVGTGVMLMIGSCLSLQFGAALAVSVFPVMGPLGTTSFRFAFAALVVVALFRPKFWTWDGKQWLSVVCFGAVLSCMNAFFYLAIDRLPMGIAVSLEFLGPLLLAGILSRKLRDFGWIALALGGISLFFFDDFSGDTRLDPLGVGFVLVAAFCWALYILCGSWVAQRVPGTGGIAGALVIGTVCLMPFGVQSAHFIVDDPMLLLFCLGSGLLSLAVPYSLQFMAMCRIPKSVFGVLLSLEPVFAALVGWLILGQSLSVVAVLAIVLVVTASAGSTLGARAKAS